MSFITVPAVVNSGAPGVNDDVTKGFAVGDLWVDSSVSPRVAYTCTNNSTGAATWTSGGVSAHTALTTLGWSAAGHTGTATSVACFNGAGAAQTVQATADGQVLQRIGGVLVFATVAATVGIGAADDRTLDVWYFSIGNDIIEEPTGAAQGPGSIV